MAFSNVPTFPQGGPQAWALQILNATGTTITQILAAGTNGTIVESINISNNDTATAQVSFYLNDGTNNHLMGTSPAVAGAGTSSQNAEDGLRSGAMPGMPVDANGNYVIYIPSGWKLMAAVGTAVTSGKTVDIVCMGVNY